MAGTNHETIQQALKLCQSSLSAAEKELQDLRVENATLKAAAAALGPKTGSSSAVLSGRSGPSRLSTRWIGDSNLIKHAAIIVSVAKKLAVYQFPWISKDSFGLPCPILTYNGDENPEAKYLNTETLDEYITFVLYQELPAMLHGYLEEMPAFQESVCILAYSRPPSELRPDIFIVYAPAYTGSHIVREGCA